MIYNTNNESLIPKGVIPINKQNKLGSAASAVLAVLLVGAVGSNYVENRSSDSISITYRELSDSSSQGAFNDSSANGVSLSLSGEVTAIEPDGSVVLKSSDPDTTVIAALDGEYSVGDTLSISGSISRLDGNSVYLEGCSAQELSPPASEPDERAQTTAAEATTATTLNGSTTAQTAHEPIQTTAATSATTTTTEPIIADEEISVTVYVSSTGKYHSKSDCSGMKSYTAMSLDESLDAGHVACKKCW